VGIGSNCRPTVFCCSLYSVKKMHQLQEGKSKAMCIDMEGDPRNLSLAALSEQCRREINAACRGEAHDDQYWVELLHRAKAQGDYAAREVAGRHLGQVARAWLGSHPKRKEACRLESETYYMTRTCERFWQASEKQELGLERLSTALKYLRISLNSVILDTLRVHEARSTAKALLELAGTAEATGQMEQVEKRLEGGQEWWERIRGLLSTEREQRVAYLLFHCGLQPMDIVRMYPQEFSSLQEISLVRRTVIEQLLARG
jgi:hypothetical protein